MPSVKTVVALAGCLLWLQAGPGQAAESSGHALPDFSTLYSPRRDPFADGREALELARRTDRRVLIEVGGDWCTWCHILDRVIRDHPELAETLHGNYVLLKVNVSEANENAEFMRGMPRLSGYPKLYVSDQQGSILHSQDPAELANGESYDPALLLEFLRRWGPPPGSGEGQPGRD